MRKLIDIAGQRFGRLLAIKFIRVNGEGRWECKCDCGGVALSNGSNLRNGSMSSCGCRKRESTVATNKNRIKHGQALKSGATSVYKIWSGMKGRCNNPTNQAYRNYGARGITVCDRWNIFDNFLKDMCPRPKGYSIDRIDTNGNYEPSNCYWATSIEQNRNKRNNVMLTYLGETMCIVEWAIKIGVNKAIIGDRIRRGWSIEDALTKAVRFKAQNDKSIMTIGESSVPRAI